MSAPSAPKKSRPRPQPSPGPSLPDGVRLIVWDATLVTPADLVPALAGLAGVSGHPVWARPFAADGVLARAGRGTGWGAGADRAARENRLATALQDLGPGCLHVRLHEGAGDGGGEGGGEGATPEPGLQAGLIEAAAAQGWRHLVLHQREGLARLSAWVARGAELPRNAAQMRELLARDRQLGVCAARVIEMLAQARGDGPEAVVVALEDLLPGGPLTQPAGAAALMDRLGVPAQDASRQAAPQKLAGLSMPVAQAVMAPLALDGLPADLLLRESLWQPHAGLPPAFLRAEIQTHAGPSRPVRGAMLQTQPHPVVAGESVLLAGVVLAADALPDNALSFSQGGLDHPLVWRQPSPAMPARFPGLPEADRARFKPAVLRVEPSLPVRLNLRSPSGAPWPVADLRFVPRDPGRPAMRGILLAAAGIGYQAVPKVACTSLKLALYRAATDQAFDDVGAALDRGHVHEYFNRRAQDISGAPWRFIVVRDPVRRFLSAYANRIVQLRELSAEALARSPLRHQAGALTPDPDIEAFIAGFATWRRVPTIEHHFAPMAGVISPLAAFSRVYVFEELDTLCRDLSERLGQPFSLPHSQKSARGPAFDALSSPAQAALLRLLAPDYELLAGLYAPPPLRPSGISGMPVTGGLGA